MSRRPFHPSELDGADDDGASTVSPSDLLVTARELEWLDSGAIRPSEGFTDRVLAAIALEPLPAPMAVAGTAAREGRVGAMLAALRDTWHVAWSGGRPMAARAQAMAFVLLLVVAVGSVSGLATIGAVGALFPPATPALHPTQPVPAVATPSPRPTPSPSPSIDRTEPPEPSETAEPTDTHEPTDTLEPEETEKPHETPEHTSRPTHGPEESEHPSNDDSHEGGHDESPHP